MLEERADKDVG